MDYALTILLRSGADSRRLRRSKQRRAFGELIISLIVNDGDVDVDDLVREN